MRYITAATPTTPAKKRKVTPEEATEMLIEEISNCIARRWKLWAIKQLIGDLIPEPTPAKVQRIIQAAHRRLLDREGRDTRVARGESLAFYESIVGDEAAPLGERLRAQERIDALLGLAKREQQAAQDNALSPAAIVEKMNAATRGTG